MHFTKQQMLIFLSVASVAVAQNFSSLPACATPGALTAITTTGCANTDIACICQSQSFTSSLEQYAKQNCNAQDYATVVTTGQSICAQAGVDVPIPSSSAAGADTATMMSTPATTMATSMAGAGSGSATVAPVATTTRCKCEDDMPTATSPVAIATFTGAAVREVGSGKHLVAGVVGFVGLVGFL